MFNKSIAYRLTLFISLAVIAVFVAFITANYLFNRKLLRDNIENHAISMSMEINSLVNQNTITTNEVAKNIAKQIIYYSQNEGAEFLLSMAMKEYPFLNAIHVKIDSAVSLPFNHYYIFHDTNGELIFKQNSEPVFYCKSEKEIYENILGADDSGWSEPYRCHEKGNVVVSYFTPVIAFEQDGQETFSGHVICELSLTELNEAINQMEIGERGYAFLITHEGDYITHPYEDWILNQNAYSLPSKSINRNKINLDTIFQNRLTGSIIVYPEILNFEKSWAYYTPVNENRWFLIFILPYKELFNELNWVTFRMILFALAGILFIYLIIYFITKKLIEPLSDVTSRLTVFRGEDFIKNNTSNEVQIVSETLEYLREWFDQYRTVSEEEEMKSLRRKQDLQQASEIQMSLIKTNFPAFPNRNDIDLYAIYKPARVVSGDLFDYFFIDNENLVFTIGDVSGKGIPAAIFMSVAQTIIRSKADVMSSKEIVTKTNIELSTSNHHQYFLTLFLGVLNLRTGILNYCNGAHDFPFILKPDGKITELNVAHGLPLGLYPEKEYKESKIKLDEGDTIILYTDGVTELLNEKKVQFGNERLKEDLQKFCDFPPIEIVKNIEKNLNEFKGDNPQTDDICLFAIKYMP
ncbi:SpoIIE family protein phosphatase [Mariniphaga sp.]|uniref:SpoIIE family protein phosphatase n=1 Tax=Mariniphaga sp. TaxID=1954475 RepID=UPI0035628C66